MGVLGVGYVGLSTSVVLAELGHQVIGMDTDEGKLDMLRRGEMPIYEPGVQSLLRSGISSGRLSFEATGDGIADNDVVFVTVQTPPSAEGGADTTYLEAAAGAIGESLRSKRENAKRKSAKLVVVNKSTVPIGSANLVEMLLRQRDNVEGEDFAVVSNPEFLREGQALYDSLYPDRIVLGANDPEAIEVMRALYGKILTQSFVPPSGLPRPEGKSHVPLVLTDIVTAEIIKYAANAFLAMKISFINEMAELCELVGGDVRQVALGIGLDKRIGAEFLDAGIGWGGSCFGKDIAALIHMASEYQHRLQLLEAVVAVNERQRLWVLRKLQETLKIIKGKTVGVLGLAFKPGTDDLRDAPSLTVISELRRRGATVRAFDPVVRAGQIGGNDGVVLCADPYECAVGCDALVLLTEWHEFKELDLAQLRKHMRSPVFLDGRNVVRAEEAGRCGFEFRGVGR